MHINFLSLFLLRTSGANKVKKLTEIEMEPHHRVYEIMALVAILLMIGGMVFNVEVFSGYGPFIL